VAPDERLPHPEGRHCPVGGHSEGLCCRPAALSHSSVCVFTILVFLLACHATPSVAVPRIALPAQFERPYSVQPDRLGNSERTHDSHLPWASKPPLTGEGEIWFRYVRPQSVTKHLPEVDTSPSESVQPWRFQLHMKTLTPYPRKISIRFCEQAVCKILRHWSKCMDHLWIFQ